MTTSTGTGTAGNPSPKPQQKTYAETVASAAAAATPEDHALVARLTKPIPGVVQALHSETVMITPGAAGLILRDHNGINRSLRDHLARKYQRALERGAWSLTAEGPKFDVNGKLRDSQHRLYGVVLSGRAVELYVTTGDAVDSAAHYDGGTSRTAADILVMKKGMDERTAKIRWYVIRSAVAYMDHAEHRKPRSLDRDEIVDLAERHAATLAPAINLAERSLQTPAGMPASYEPCLSERDAALVAYLMLSGGWSTAIVGSFLAEFQLGTGEGENNPIVRGAEILLADRARNAAKGLKALQRVGLSIEVAGLWATNRRKAFRSAPKMTNLPSPTPPEGLAADLIGGGMPLVDTPTTTN